MIPYLSLMLRLLPFLFFVLSFNHILGQGNQPYDGQRLENIIEQFIENNDIEEFDVTDIVERLVVLQRKPINLNTATENELNDLIFLTTVEINAILNHRAIYGDFVAVEELQTIPQIPSDKISLVSNFLAVSNSDQSRYNFKDILNAGRSTLFLKYKRILQEKKGYQTNDEGETPYIGTPDHYFARYRFDSGRAFRAGVTMEKDPGEAFFSGPNKEGFDFYSAYVYAEGIKPWLQTVVLGDYTISLGQGLILQNAFGTGKSVYTVDIKSGGQVIRPYSSVNEVNFFRGGATTIKPTKNISTTLFYSNKKIDGTVRIDTNAVFDFGRFTSIARGGLHRTENEIAKKGSITQENYGGRIEYKKGSFRLGLNHLTYQFSIPSEPQDAPYRLFTFTGDNLSATSIDYSYRYRNANLFGEISRTQNGGLAQLYSAIVSLDKTIDLAVSYRKYDKDYLSLEANSFSESTLPINEEGIYLGIENRIDNNWKFSAYIDYWRHPWLRFRVDAPSQGREFLFRLDYIKKRQYNIYLQYRFENKQRNSSAEGLKVDPIVDIYNHRARLHFSYNINKSIELRSRIEGSTFDIDGNRTFGYALYQDIFIRPFQSPLSLNARFMLFDTDNFDNRIYTYENDLLYEFGIPFFQRQGMRTYLNFRYKIKRYATWEFKIARTLLTNFDQFGSGNELILSPTRTEFKTQFKFTF